MTDPADPPRRHLVRWLLRVMGLALFALVLWKVDWRDAVTLRNGEEIRGQFVGEVPERLEPGTKFRFRSVDGVEQQFDVAELAADPKSGLPKANEGLLHIVERSDKTLLLAAFLLYGFVTQIGVLRWWLLLRAQDIRIPFLTAGRLTFIGFFFNSVVPGPTGGDVVKALYAARSTSNRAQAVVTVVIDRVAGIIALGLIAAVALLAYVGDGRYAQPAGFVGIFLGSVALGGIVFFSRRIRSFLRVEQWSAKLPAGQFLRRADEAFFHWRKHKKDLGVALLLSLANQLSIHGLMILIATALHVTTKSGEPLPWTTYMVVLPVSFIVTAVPLLPGGWGVREAAFAYWFDLVGVASAPAITLSVVNGMLGLVWSLLGGVFFVVGRAHEPPAAARETAGQPS